jgi:hypothetical protein
VVYKVCSQGKRGRDDLARCKCDVVVGGMHGGTVLPASRVSKCRNPTRPAPVLSDIRESSKPVPQPHGGRVRGGLAR